MVVRHNYTIDQISAKDGKIDVVTTFEIEIEGESWNISWELCQGHIVVGNKDAKVINVYDLEEGNLSHQIKVDFICEIIQMDMNYVYAFSHKDVGKINKYDATDIYYKGLKLIYSETNDNLSINYDCFSTFNGEELNHTILTMSENRVEVFDTIYKKIIARYYLRGTVHGLLLTRDKQKLAIYTTQNNLYLVESPSFIKTDEAQ